MYTSISRIEDKYEILEKLGNGIHADVYKSKELATGKFRALKISKKAITKRKKLETEEWFLHEVGILQKLEHPNIVRIIQAYSYSHHYTICLEMLNGGELFNYIADLDEIMEFESKFFAKQILNALAYIHSLNIAHLDLKPENIVLASKNELAIKIIDFSLSSIITDSHSVKKLCGTPEFMAPEAVNYDFLTTASDLWSFGVILFFLLSGCSPFLGTTVEDTHSNILKNNVDYEINELQNISFDSIDLVKTLLVLDSVKRLTAKQALEHEWFSNSKGRARRASSIATYGFREYRARSRFRISVQTVMTVNILNQLETKKN